jgi:two-component system sensor histidine kinase PhoQ
LKPLNTLKHELAIVEQGKSSQLTQNYPQELSAVTKQVNLLLTTEQNQRQRYRNALSDLAHSLKTPLAVIQSQLDLSINSQEQLNLINQTIEHQLKRAQSAGKSAWHLGIKIKPIAEKLIKTLNKIHQQKQLTINYQIDSKSIFKGDEADLMEILGNLLDNACKAAQAKINLVIMNSNKTIEIRVEDDGKGVEETQRNIILQRGIRSDTYQKGHGIGLAIVRDLVDTYQGQLTISKSPELGGALFTIKFSL